MTNIVPRRRIGDDESLERLLAADEGISQQTHDEEPSHNEPRVQGDGDVWAELSFSDWTLFAIGSCATLPWFYFIKLMAEYRLSDTYLCMHSKLDILKFSLHPEALSGFVVLMAGMALIFLLVIGLFTLLKGSDVMDQIAPPNKFFELWIHLSDLQEGLDWKNIVEKGRKEKTRRAETTRTYWSKKVQQNGFALQYASEQLKGDVDVVKLAVQQRGFALQYASEQLKGNADVVKLAVRQDWHALEYASEQLKGDARFRRACLPPFGASTR